MMLPTTYSAALLLTILSMLCWGSWANSMKLTGKWRFELLYFDYAIGVLLAATIAGLTFGSFDNGALDAGVTAFSFADGLAIAGKKQMAFAFAGGVVFNLANMLLVAAIAVAGMSVGFPVGIGLALIVGVITNYIIRPAGNPALLFGGSLVVVAAIVTVALAHAAHSRAKSPARPAAAPGAGAIRDQRYAPGKPASPAKGISLSLASGVLMGLFYPLVELSKKGDLGLGPYTAAFLFAVGVFLSTPVFNIFFMNMPVEGDAVAFRDYLRGTAKQHFLGLAGGMIWTVGTISNFVAASAPASVNVGPAVSYAIGQGATLISTLWGLLLWKEFAGATAGVRARLAVMLTLFVVGLAMLSVAPLYK